jgi:hypothetical protein
MTLRLRELRLVALTSEGRFGTELSFDDGLNVIRADNTQGKSTVMESVIYALGLDAIIDMRQTVPLTSAMTDLLRTPEDVEVAVRESFVMLEIENHDGERLTCQRYAKHESIDRHLVRSWRGGALSNPDVAYEQVDLYVRRPGAAQNPAGFHRMLAEFLGWNLPGVVREDGSEVPLYMELVFPLLYVEQRRGWGGIQATMPTYGIPSARRRALEFLLDLGIYRRARTRAELLAELRKLQSAYAEELSRLNGLLETRGLVMQGLDPELPTFWPEVPPRLLAPVEGDQWIGLDELLAGLRSELQKIVEEEIPNAEAASKEVAEGLERDEQLLRQLSAAATALREEASLDEEQEDALRRRIAGLAEDERRYDDAITLQKLGSDETHVHLGDACPTCHQALPAALLVADEPPPMSLEDNLAFIKEQRSTFRLMRSDTERGQRVKRQRLLALRNRMNELRQSIRAARGTLVSPAHSPSLAAVRQRLQLEDRIAALDGVAGDFVGFEERISVLIAKGAEIRDRLASVPLAKLDEEDEAKLVALEVAFKEQLAAYGFGSFGVGTVGISRENYLPTREGFDLGFVTSASDLIRLVWAYLLGLLEVDRSFETNHPGLLMFDEPGQQSIAELSFEALLQRASAASDFGQQVVFATSQPQESLERFLEGRPYRETIYTGRVLAPLD